MQIFTIEFLDSDGQLVQKAPQLASCAGEAEAKAKLLLEIVEFNPPAVAFRVGNGAQVQTL